jgi:Tfp pilus assembly protein PilO
MNENLPTQNRFARFRRYYTALEPILEKPRTRVYTAVIFSFLAISLFGWYAIKPTVQTIITLRKEIADKTVLNQQMEQKITSLIEAQNVYQEIQPQLPLLQEAIPTDPEAIELVLQVRNLVQTTEATMSSGGFGNVPLVSSDESDGKKTTSAALDTREYNVNTSLVGGFPSLETLLNGFMTMRRITTIQSITIVPSTDSTIAHPLATKILNLSLVLKSYFKPL